MRENWTDRQKNIYEGLSSIGPEISGFYEAGLNILYSSGCPNGSNFLMHAAREIDGGLRDILAVDFIPEKEEKEGHKKSILFSLGVEQFEGFSSDWYSVSRKLHKYAHRRGAWKNTREMGEVKETWARYEDVLEKLVGSYYSIIERIEHIGRLKTLEGGPFEVLCNILSIPFYSNYFFRREADPKWFFLLKEKLYFAPERIEFDEEGNALYWNVLDYLEKVSGQASQDSTYGKELIDIICGIVQFSLNKKRIGNSYIWWDCVKILNNLPSNIIQENLTIEQFREWLMVMADSSSGRNLTVHDISEKLLTKFLADEYPAGYAETIIDIITRIESKKKPRRGFNRGEAKLAWDSYWILQAFRKNYERVAQKCTVQCILGVADKLNNALKQKQQNNSTNIELNDKIIRVDVSRVHLDDNEKNTVAFKDDVYHCNVSGFSEKQLQGIEKNDHVSLHAIEKPDNHIKGFDITAKDKSSFDAQIVKGLPETIPWEEDKDFEKGIDYLFEGLYSDYSYIWFNRSLASGGGEHAGSAEVVLTIILRDTLLAKCKMNPDEGRQILEQFLTPRYRFSLFKRFVLLCVDKFWDEYSTFLEDLFEVAPNALEESNFDVELHDVFLHHNSKFSNLLLEKLKKMIDQVPAYYVGKDENLSAYWKYQWLSPLRDHPDFTQLYEDAKSEADLKEDKPHEPDRETMKGGWVTHKSPVSKQDLLGKPVSEIIKELKEFQEAPGRWQRMMEGLPDRDGLADTLQSAVKEDPNKFTGAIDDFFDMDYFYLHCILRGFKEAWNDGKDIEWEKVFSFGVKYFDRDKNVILKEAFQAQGEDSGNGRYIWIVEDFVDLIADGSRNDDRAFDSEYFESANRIFDFIIPLLKGEKHPDTERDALTYALNTTLGRTVMDYVSFSLRVARSTKKKGPDWGKNKFERFFSIGIDACIWFGSYLPQMKYLDEDYTKQKIKNFEEMKVEEFEWRVFMEGYLTKSNIYQELYLLMRQNYLKALESKVFDERVDDRMVEHISIGYLNAWESLQPKNDDGKDSLFWRMLTEAGALDKGGRWLEMASFFWSITGQMEKKRSKDEEKQFEINKEKILKFWSWAFDNQDIVEKNLGENYSSFLERMAELTIYLDRIDDEKEKWLLLCAPHIDRHHHTAFFIEYLTRFDDEESIRRIGRIYKKVSENTPPTYKQEDIELIVRRIYEKGDRQDANDICNAYGRKGIHFLKPLWAEFQ